MERDAVTGRHLPPPGFGPVLRSARRARGWSYRVAAKRIGIAYGFLAEMEQGRRAPSVTVSLLLLDRLGLTGEAAEVVRRAGVAGTGRDWPGRR